MGRYSSLCRWERIKTRSLLSEQSFTNVYGEGSEWYGSDKWISQSLIHKTMILVWIDELELATKVWEEGVEERARLAEIPHVSLGELLFSVVVGEITLGWGMEHPEFSRPVRYRILHQNRAFRLCTSPFSELLKMDEPLFSSVDGHVIARFNKEELLRLAKIVPQEYHNEFRLPFLLIRSLSGLHAHDSTDYRGECKVLGSELENFVLQKLLKLTDLPFEKRKGIKPLEKVASLSMFGRRGFKTIFKILPEYSSVNYAIMPYEYREKVAELLKSIEGTNSQSGH